MTAENIRFRFLVKFEKTAPQNQQLQQKTKKTNQDLRVSLGGSHLQPCN
jgi:hypothetical protein